MSKEDKHIDNLFKEKLDGRSFDGPPADFLADLNQRLDAKPVVSKSGVWIIFLNLFIIGLFIANASIDFSTNKIAEIETQVENNKNLATKEESIKSRNEQKKESLAKENDPMAKESSNNAEIKPNELETNQVNQSSSQLNRVERSQNENNNADSNSKDSPTVKNRSNEAPNSVNRKDSNANTSKNTRGNSKASKNSNTKVSSQASKRTNSSTGNSKSIQKDKSTLRSEGNEKNNKTEVNKDPTNKEGVTFTGRESLSPYVSYSAIYAPQFYEVKSKITNNDFPDFPSQWNELVAKNDTKSPDKTTKKEKDSETRRFEIQLQGGATQWNFKTLGTSDDYVTKIDEAATPKWTPHFGLGFNVNFNSISIGTGANYSKFKTENLFDFSDINTYDSTYIAGYNENVTYDSIGNPIDTTYTPYYDSTTVTDTMYNVTPITNQYEWIQIPIHFGYRFNLNKWAVIPRVGVNIGLGIRQSSGRYPNEAYDDLQTIDPMKWHLNLHTSLEVRRDFGNWHAFGKFNYQRNLTPTIDNALFERKYNGIGFSFGIGYSF